LISLSQTSKYFYRGIKNSKIKIKKLVIIVDDSLIKWFPFLDNVKIDGSYKNIKKHIHLFSKVHTLDLSCTEVVDVSALGNVHTLDLSSTNVEDVSALGNVHTLNLSYTNVVDISALGNVHTLNVSNTNVEDISALILVILKL